jgi:type II secretion system protein I
MKFTTANNRTAFTLVEVLAALAFMAIVVPVAVGALRVASLAGEVAARKETAARVADEVLNEAVATAGTGSTKQSGVETRNGHEFQWKITQRAWTDNAMQLVTAEVTFTAEGKQYSVDLSTLEGQTQTASMP